jgi:hypothetical protein
MAHRHDDDAVAGGDSGPIGFVTGMLGAGMVEETESTSDYEST